MKKPQIIYSEKLKNSVMVDAKDLFNNENANTLALGFVDDHKSNGYIMDEYKTLSNDALEIFKTLNSYIYNGTKESKTLNYFNDSNFRFVQIGRFLVEARCYKKDFNIRQNLRYEKLRKLYIINIGSRI